MTPTLAEMPETVLTPTQNLVSFRGNSREIRPKGENSKEKI